MVRPRFGPAIAELPTHSTAGPSRWTHLVGVTGRAGTEDTPTWERAAAGERGDGSIT